MAKIREPLSICDAVRKAHAALGDAGVREVTGKSAALVTKWSDPDADDHNIQFRHAISLDVAMVRAGEMPPHLEVLKAAIEDVLPWRATVEEKPKTLSQRVADLAKEFGDFAGLVIKAETDGKVSRVEKSRLDKELLDIVKRAHEARRSLR